MLVELGVAEQRYRAVLEVLHEGAAVTDVARRYGVARATARPPYRALTQALARQGVPDQILTDIQWQGLYCAVRDRPGPGHVRPDLP